ncbi:MAG: glutamine-hydrolyzing GMP synthase [Candidatus Izemoplasmatales bacterium]|nr:glutamine-hydrolyzing GMP synthase [Candidatus Izemoplasmatales bacterium]
MNTILVIDYGSQYNMLISRRIREMNVYSLVVRYDQDFSKYEDIVGVILSGGPSSVYDDFSPEFNQKILDLNVPILGICYGMQLLVKTFGGKISSASKREYGKVVIENVVYGELNRNLSKNTSVWMSHSDYLDEMPKGFTMLSKSKNAIAMIENQRKRLYGVQFHPEVTHTEEGRKLIENFVFNICKAKKEWNVSDFLQEKVDFIKNTVKDETVILGLSGGVDSTVCAALLDMAISSQLTCIFVDTGLLRKNEAIDVINGYGTLKHLKIIKVDAKARFFEALKNITDPEEKRKIIGRVFFEVFEEEKKKHKEAKFLAQGTIYPDVIESSSVSGPSETIKSHHNVGGMPLQDSFIIIEPLRDLFKDEVRALGRILGLDDTLINRHPFPGPGLGIRVIGEVDEKRVKILQEADYIFIEELRKHGLYNKVSQAFVVLLPVKTVGVMGDQRTYENVACIRSVNTTDFMTADVSRLPFEFLEVVSSRIVNEVLGINRVTFDITSKPPGTIEWE